MYLSLSAHYKVAYNLWRGGLWAMGQVRTCAVVRRRDLYPTRKYPLTPSKGQVSLTSTVDITTELSTQLLTKAEWLSLFFVLISHSPNTIPAFHITRNITSLSY